MDVGNTHVQTLKGKKQWKLHLWTLVGSALYASSWLILVHSPFFFFFFVINSTHEWNYFHWILCLSRKLSNLRVIWRPSACVVGIRKQGVLVEDCEPKSAAWLTRIITCVFQSPISYSPYLRPGTLSGYLVWYLGWFSMCWMWLGLYFSMKSYTKQLSLLQLLSCLI